ncbi:MAG: type II secretion system F family protein, partial [Methanobacteriota archaeon]
SYIAQHYDKVLPRRTKMAISALEPAILIILGIIVGLTALSIIMPIMNIIDSF